MKRLEAEIAVKVTNVLYNRAGWYANDIGQFLGEIGLPATLTGESGSPYECSSYYWLFEDGSVADEELERYWEDADDRVFDLGSEAHDQACINAENGI